MGVSSQLVSVTVDRTSDMVDSIIEEVEEVERTPQEVVEWM